MYTIIFCMFIFCAPYAYGADFGVEHKVAAAAAAESDGVGSAGPGGGVVDGKKELDRQQSRELSDARTILFKQHAGRILPSELRRKVLHMVGAHYRVCKIPALKKAILMSGEEAMVVMREGRDSVNRVHMCSLTGKILSTLCDQDVSYAMDVSARGTCAFNPYHQEVIWAPNITLRTAEGTLRNLEVDAGPDARMRSVIGIRFINEEPMVQNSCRNIVQVFDAETGTCMARYPSKPFRTECFPLAGSDDGRLKAVGDDTCLVLYDARTSQKTHHITSSVNPSDAQFVSDKRLFVTGSQERVKEYDLRRPEEEVRSFPCWGQRIAVNDQRDRLAIVCEATAEVPYQDCDSVQVFSLRPGEELAPLIVYKLEPILEKRWQGSYADLTFKGATVVAYWPSNHQEQTRVLTGIKDLDDVVVSACAEALGRKE